MSAGAEGGCSRFNETLIFRRGLGARIAAAGPAFSFFFFLIKKKVLFIVIIIFLAPVALPLRTRGAPRSVPRAGPRSPSPPRCAARNCRARGAAQPDPPPTHRRNLPRVGRAGGKAKPRGTISRGNTSCKVSGKL